MKSPLVQQPDFGERLRKLRKQRSLSQRDLAGERITPSYISLLESGRRVPTLDVLLQLSSVLEVSLETLTGSPVDFPELSSRDTPVTASATAGDSTAVLHGSAADALLLADGSEDLPPDVLRERLEALYQELLASPPSWALFQVAFRLAQLLAALGDAQGRFDVLSTVAGLLTEGDSPGIRLRILTDLAAAARDAGNMSAARAAVADGRAMIETSGARHSIDHVRLVSVELSVRCEGDEQLSDLTPLADELLEAARHIDSPSVLGRAHWSVGTMLTRYNRAEEAVTHLLAARDMLSNGNLPIREWLHFCTALASLLIDLGVEDETARRHLNAALAITEASGWPPTPALLRAQARHLVATGAAAEAEELCRRTLTKDPSIRGRDRAQFCATWARALAALDRPAEAVEQMREAALLFEEAGHLRLAVECWRWLDRMRP
ncbi:MULTISPECIES: helix-turn-helix domain-containing protein [Streptomyces]|uniref:helix-turn-helix domain-containing protein n=1 Tax=Streptomyces TaxID=1883 RepID=UPI000A3A68FE|nr:MULTISPECIES: helix-turn-helix transcriptional regulator [Streptomyces]MDN5382155.1 helix-turn-helix domain-containing protein [Streptomyces sp. LB8]